MLSKTGWSLRPQAAGVDLSLACLDSQQRRAVVAKKPQTNQKTKNKTAQAAPSFRLDILSADT